MGETLGPLDPWPRLKVAVADFTEPRPIIRSDHPLYVVVVGDPEVMRA